jgi:site-specific DNA recombinase
VSEGRKAAVYVRISRDREGAGLGVQRQEQDCRELAQRLGWQVVGVYCDNDVSASDRRKKRNEYLRMCDDVKAGRVDAILTWHMDRLHRQPAELEQFIDLLEGRDVAIQTVKAGEVDPNSPSGRMVLRMLGAAARYEVDHKSDRLRRKFTEMAEAGRRNGGTRAFGYRRVDGSEEIDEEIDEDEAKIIREAADRILMGASLRSVCRDLNTRGVRSVSGKLWASSTLKRILLSPRVVGKRQHHGKVVAVAKWPPILDQETHAALVKILTDPARRTNGGYSKRYYLLSGMMRCWRCDAILVARPTGEKRRSYVCNAPVPGLNGCQNGRLRVTAEELEEYVAKSVMARYLESPALAKALADQGEAASEQRHLMVEAESIKDALDELEQDYRVHRLMSRESYLQTHADLTTRRREVDMKINEASGQRFLRDVPRDPQELKAAYEGGAYEWRRAFIESLVEKITIGPGVRGLNRFDPARVKIKYRA